MRPCVLCSCLLIIAQAAAASEPMLPRRASLGFAVADSAEGLRITRLVEHSAAARAGLREDDLIVAINDVAAVSGHAGRDLLRRLEGEAPVELRIRRAGDIAVIAFSPPREPFETFAGVTASYGAIDTPDGAILRTLVTRPEGANGPLPAIFFTQWVSCDSVEINRPGVWLDVMRGVIERSGMVFIRVERASGGDSRGPGCHELDYDTEVAHYRHAFDQLVRPPLVDIERVYVWGNSLGSTTAPLVAQGKRVAGIIVGGGGAQTYFERMLQFDRIGFERSGMDPREIDDRMRRHAEFHVEYLLRGKDPADIAAERPELSDVWAHMRGTGEGVHYGRPYAWHRQAAMNSFLQAWVDFGGDALVLFHEYDQFEYGEGHRLIVDTLNRLRPGSATLTVLPKTGHDYRVYPTADHALRGEAGVPAPELAIQPILSWLKAR